MKKLCAGATIFVGGIAIDFSLFIGYSLIYSSISTTPTIFLEALKEHKLLSIFILANLFIILGLYLMLSDLYKNK